MQPINCENWTLNQSVNLYFHLYRLDWVILKYNIIFYKCNNEYHLDWEKFGENIWVSIVIFDYVLAVMRTVWDLVEMLSEIPRKSQFGHCCLGETITPVIWLIDAFWSTRVN